MPVYIDIHELTDATPEAIADAHTRDVAVQDTYGVNYHKYWLDRRRGKVFCLCTAPNAEAAEQVHRHAHGLVAERIVEVDPDLAEGMLGGMVAPSGAATLGPDGALDSGERSILFTDIVGSTALTQRLGDHAALAVVERHDAVVRAAFAQTRGREVKHLGDGMMGVFVTADDAVRCALEVHRALAAAGGPSAGSVRVRIGVATGVPIERQGDFFGTTVQLAARLCEAAEPGETLVAPSVVEAATAHRFIDAGEVRLKGFPEPVRAHAVAGAA